MMKNYPDIQAKLPEWVSRRRGTHQDVTRSWEVWVPARDDKDTSYWLGWIWQCYIDERLMAIWEIVGLPMTVRQYQYNVRAAADSNHRHHTSARLLLQLTEPECKMLAGAMEGYDDHRTAD